MSPRKYISLVAMLGMIVHAAAFVRHAVAMSSPASGSEQALLADLGVICHIDQNGNAAAPADLPAPSSTPQQTPKCPLCLGLVAVFALPSVAPHLLPPATGPPARLAVLDQFDVPSCASALQPPVRGPPLA